MAHMLLTSFVCRPKAADQLAVGLHATNSEGLKLGNGGCAVL